MATGIMVLRHLNRLFGEGTLAGRRDALLLDRFVRQRDEAAFAALVAGHGPMVLGTCRAVLQDPDAAEDAFQVLVRKAGSIRGHAALGGWHGAVRRRAGSTSGRGHLVRGRRSEEPR
jgi:hypothetical protein